MAAYFPYGMQLQGNQGFRRLSYDNECVRGSAVSLGMHHGMRMNVSNFESRSPLAFQVEHAPMELELSFSRGRGSHCLMDGKRELSFGGGNFHVGRFKRDTRFALQTQEGATEQSIHLNLTPDVLKDLLGTSVLPEKIAKLLATTDPVALFGGGMDGRMYSITDEILSTASERVDSGVGRRLFLEGKAMELVAVLCDRLSEEEEPVRTRSEEDKLHQARDILHQNWEHPPKTQELARQLGMGEGRLKSGFKALFGAPVMSYARSLRLEHARSLLSSRHHNVTQVAHLVGYANPSKFAAAYRRQFGIAPSAS